MADAASLEAAATVLLTRADDLYYVGGQLVERSDRTTWECAKGDRYREAMIARASECRRLAAELRDLGVVLKARAQAAQAPAPVPGA
jgi:hypothetical protein